MTDINLQLCCSNCVIFISGYLIRHWISLILYSPLISDPLFFPPDQHHISEIIPVETRTERCSWTDKERKTSFSLIIENTIMSFSWKMRLWWEIRWSASFLCCCHCFVSLRHDKLMIKMSTRICMVDRQTFTLRFDQYMKHFYCMETCISISRSMLNIMHSVGVKTT